MPVFQVSSRSAQLSIPPKKHARRLPYQWVAIIRFIIAVQLAGGLFALLTTIKGRSDIVFILLPVFLYLASIQFQHYKLIFPIFPFNTLFNGTPIYLLLTACLALIYYSALTAIVLLIHQSATVSHIILITTTLGWAIMLGPVHTYVQQLIERRFNLRNRETARAIEAFTSTLRQEIDLDQLRERFLSVIQQTIQPYSVSLWILVCDEQQEKSTTMEEIKVADDDLLLAYMRNHSNTLQIERLQLASPILENMKSQAAEIVLPLATQGELVGLLVLGPGVKGEEYTPEQRSLLNRLAPQVAPALRVAQMVQEQQVQIRERERIEQELRTARAIQHAFLPKDVPAFPEWRLAPYYQPAREVGGDFYDFLSFSDGRLGLVIGDVTGKGIPAALVMATVHTMLRTAVQEISSPGGVLARVNNLLSAEIPTGMFVTCFFALLDPKSGQLCYANAGHEPPFRQQKSSAAELWATGMPLGMLPDTQYDEHQVILSPGENLLFYSDGLVEAHNPTQEMFGFPRLQKLLEEHTDAATLIDFLLAELKCFTGKEWEQEDDVTLVTLHRMPEVL